MRYPAGRSKFPKPWYAVETSAQYGILVFSNSAILLYRYFDWKFKCIKIDGTVPRMTGTEKSFIDQLWRIFVGLLNISFPVTTDAFSFPRKLQPNCTCIFTICIYTPFHTLSKPLSPSSTLQLHQYFKLTNTSKSTNTSSSPTHPTSPTTPPTSPIFSISTSIT